MIYTGYFARTKQYLEQGLTTVAISGYVPAFYNGLRYKELAPKKATFDKWKSGEIDNFGYTELYKKEVLNNLNPQKVINELSLLGDKVILLCYEKSGDFCHRHIVADWLEANGVVVEEYNAATK